jgi:NADP-dependent 3-hydroxy acid dehydrogenase YdfG
MADDPVFLITGASSGIGAATARRAADAGYRVVLAARSTDKLERLAKRLGGPGRALAVTCDVTDFGQQEAMVRAALDAFGRVDVAFANAGFGAARGFLKESPEFWREMVLTNVLGCAYTIRAASSPARSTAPRSTPSRRWRRPPARTSTTRASASPRSSRA